MTGAEHYTEAERLLTLVVQEDPENLTVTAVNQQLALVHATLALAAATAEPIANKIGGRGRARDTADAWSDAIS